MEPSNRHAMTLEGGQAAGRVFNALVVSALFLLVVASSLPDASATQVFRWPHLLLFPLTLVIAVVGIVGSSLLTNDLAVPRFDWVLGSLGLVTSAVASAFLHQRHSANYQALLLVFVGVAVFFCVFFLVSCNQERSLFIAAGISGSGLIVVAVSLYRWIMVDIPMALGLMDPLNQLAGEELLRFSFADHRNANPFGHQNYIAGAILLFIPWHVRSLSLSKGRVRFLWGIALALDLICLVSTFSRGAWLGLAAGGAAFVIWMGAERVVSRNTLVRIGLGLMVLGAVLLAANPRMRSSIARLSTHGSTQVDQVRSNMAEAGWLMFKDNWLFGVGPGNATSAYPAFRSQLAAGLEDNYQLHITPLQIGVEQGVVGLSAWALLVFASWKSFRRRAADGGSIAVTSFICLVTYGIFSLTDYQLDVLPIVILLFLNFALMAAAGNRSNELSPAAGNLVVVAVLIATTAFLILLAPELRGRSIFHSAMTSLRDGEPDQFEAKTVQAAEVAPSPQYYLNQLASYHADQWFNSTNEATRVRQLSTAQDWFLESLKENPDQEYCYFNLGWMLQDVEPIQSAGNFVAAARLVPDRKGVFRGLALSLMNAGETNAATQSLALECLVNPTFVAAAFWSHEGHEDLWPTTHARLTQDLQRAVAQFPVGNPSRRMLEQRLAALDWLESGSMDGVRQQEWPPAIQEFWDTVGSNDGKAVRDDEPRVAWKYLHDAWANETDRESLVTSAVILSTKKIPNADVVDRLVRWVSRDKWGDVIRRVPPPELFRAFGRQRSGFNLLARNLDGIKPTDVCAYVDNHVVELFFEFVYGRKNQVSSLFVLERLDEILDEVPQLKDAAFAVRVPVEKP